MDVQSLLLYEFHESAIIRIDEIKKIGASNAICPSGSLLFPAETKSHRKNSIKWTNAALYMIQLTNLKPGIPIALVFSLIFLPAECASGTAIRKQNIFERHEAI